MGRDIVKVAKYSQEAAGMTRTSHLRISEAMLHAAVHVEGQALCPLLTSGTERNLI